MGPRTEQGVLASLVASAWSRDEEDDIALCGQLSGVGRSLGVLILVAAADPMFPTGGSGGGDEATQDEKLRVTPAMPFPCGQQDLSSPGLCLSSSLLEVTFQGAGWGACEGLHAAADPSPHGPACCRSIFGLIVSACLVCALACLFVCLFPAHIRSGFAEASNEAPRC